MKLSEIDRMQQLAGIPMNESKSYEITLKEGEEFILAEDPSDGNESGIFYFRGKRPNGDAAYWKLEGTFAETKAQAERFGTDVEYVERRRPGGHADANSRMFSRSDD